EPLASASAMAPSVPRTVGRFIAVSSYGFDRNRLPQCFLYFVPGCVFGAPAIVIANRSKKTHRPRMRTVGGSIPYEYRGVGQLQCGTPGYLGSLPFGPGTPAASPASIRVCTYAPASLQSISRFFTMSSIALTTALRY